MRVSSRLRVAILPSAVVIGIVALSFVTLPYARAAQIALVFVLFVNLAVLLKGRLQNACIVLASIAFGLTIVEGVAEARLPRIEVNYDKSRWERDADLGYRARHEGVIPAKKVVNGRTIFDVGYTIDADRNRLTVSNPHGSRVRFFGDSYTFGEGLTDGEALPQIFANMTGANVINYSYPGYSPAQALRALERGLYDKHMEGAKLFILQTGPFHVERIACLPFWTRGFPKYIVEDGKLKFDGTCAPAAQAESGAYKLLVEPKLRSITHADVETYLQVVDAFIAMAHDKYHVPVLILDMVFDSDNFDNVGFNQTAVEDHFRSKDAMVIDDALAISATDRMIPDDGHPTGAANRLMARKTVDYLARTRPELGITLSQGMAASRND